MLYTDTIAAIATPVGEGGVGIVRLSGPDALAIARRIFQPRHGGDTYRPQLMRYGRVIDAEGRSVDEALAVFFKAPRSYTREDVVEIHCHGGALPLRRTLELALAAGARLAEPGEFTMRAFLNGRLDLAQAEATLDLIQARTATSLQLALEQLGGRLSREVRAAREAALGALAYLTALVDFPEDDVPEQDVLEPLRQARAQVAALVRSADQGILYRYGARAVLVGRPNAGKSSLLNALLRVERAIVTPIAGTTRDTLEETANLGGVPVVLIDTAGITATDDPVERIGVERSRRALATADLVLLVLDRAAALSDEDMAIAALTHGRPTVLVLNKADLPPQLDAQPLIAAHPTLRAQVTVSATTGQGLEELGATVARALLGGSALPGETLVTNPRHRDALSRALEQLDSALAALQAGLSVDLVAVDVGAVVQALGEVTGETVGEDLLTAIFSRFCIGK
ncbi:tRNA uridine-5-carboxymethylaminomethyl(34) synthesis GTPase MnmE [Kallotenue papyrolyticum]|uniref:tRNA uridine-5-carboxymethylaminomethyl(34) synthesis GTPase MnmE n=1 Tax=Kallotenue papyrolyticum TaxID=1325125 RepID=UPI0004B1EAB8|nr:tRNA uridine-5-carboxymethylaminomethyl(34) synthesis GTPase MnmE [Kallotenue papyrolyticum]